MSTSLREEWATLGTILGEAQAALASPDEFKSWRRRHLPSVSEEYAEALLELHRVNHEIPRFVRNHDSHELADPILFDKAFASWAAGSDVPYDLRSAKVTPAIDVDEDTASKLERYVVRAHRPGPEGENAAMILRSFAAKHGTTLEQLRKVIERSYVANVSRPVRRFRLELRLEVEETIDTMLSRMASEGLPQHALMKHAQGILRTIEETPMSHAPKRG